MAKTMRCKVLSPLGNLIVNEFRDAHVGMDGLFGEKLLYAMLAAAMVRVMSARSIAFDVDGRTEPMHVFVAAFHEAREFLGIE